MRRLWRFQAIPGFSPLLLLGLALVTVEASAQDSDPGRPQKTTYVPAGYTKTFGDEFDRLELDMTASGTENWVTHFPWTADCPGYNVRHFADNQNQQLWVSHDYAKDGKKLGLTLHEITDQGTLKLFGRRTPRDRLDVTDGFPYVAGAITSQCSFWQQYGYFEARMRFDFTKGHHWAFWMLPKDHTHTPLELDIVERVGREGEFDRVYQNSHGEPVDKPITVHKIPGDYRDWVTYGVTWTRTEIVWHLNGKETRRMRNFIAEPMYLIVSLEIGGKWPGLTDGKTQWPTTAEIDYIRVYQKEG